MTAMLRFVRNEIPAFGTLYRDYGDELPRSLALEFMVNNLKTRAEVLQWYLEINSGGGVHSEEELARVRELLARERVGECGNEPEESSFFGDILNRLDRMEEIECVRCGTLDRMDPDGDRLCAQCEFYRTHPDQEPGYFTWRRSGGGWVAVASWRDGESLPEAGAIIDVHRKDGSSQSKTVVRTELDGFTMSGWQRIVCVIR